MKDTVPQLIDCQNRKFLCYQMHWGFGELGT